MFNFSFQFSKRDIIHTSCVPEANGCCLSVAILRFPQTIADLPSSTMDLLHAQMEVAYLRSQTQLRGYRTWNMELKFSKWGGK